MFEVVPEVHLFVCLDPALSPGPVLQALDYTRAKCWQSEAIIVCDTSWKPFVNIDQSVLYVSKDDFFNKENQTLNAEVLENFLEQLDEFGITKVTQLGELGWGRWLNAYLEGIEGLEYSKITSSSASINSIEAMNELASDLEIDLTLPVSEKTKSSAIYIDPYEADQLSPQFIELAENLGSQKIPEHIFIISRDEDLERLEGYGLGDSLVDFEESQVGLFNQFVLCFSDQSPLALTSRSYQVALFNCEAQKSLFVPGDISISTKQDIHFSELINILAYWKSKRLKELAFQWLNMGVEVKVLEVFHSRVILRNLLNYSSDLYHCQAILEFAKNSRGSKHALHELVDSLRKSMDNDPYALSFSIKLLSMIVERMLSSAEVGERLFKRLGSDYHRIIIGESLVEHFIESSDQPFDKIDIKKQLKNFLNLLIEIDYINDQVVSISNPKESL